MARENWEGEAWLRLKEVTERHLVEINEILKDIRDDRVARRAIIEVLESRANPGEA